MDGAVDPDRRCLAVDRSNPDLLPGAEDRMIDITEIIIHHLADHPLFTLPFGMTVTKHTLMMWIASALAITLVFTAGRGTGHLRTAMEGYVTFIWDDIVRPAVGEAGRPLLH